MKKILFTLIFFAGCASNFQYVELPDPALSVADASKARIYVLRPSAYSVMQKASIYDGENKIGMIGPKGYLSWERDPGSVVIRGAMLGASSHKVRTVVEAGKVYYFRYYLDVSIASGQPPTSTMEEYSSKAKALEDFQKCKKPKIKSLS